MTIKQALKFKQKLIKKNTENFSRLRSYNSVEEGTDRPYNPLEALEAYKKGVDELVELKTRIHIANTPVHSKIFRLSELKSFVSNIKNINCLSGKVSNRHHVDEPTIFVSAISLVEKDKMVEEIEAEIEKLQEELDIHNASTKID